MRIQHVQQTNAYNCGSAVLAMALGSTTCEAIEKKYDRDPAREHPQLADHPDWKDVPDKYRSTLGWSSDEICFVLFNEGLRCAHIYSWNTPQSASSLVGKECQNTKFDLDEVQYWMDQGPNKRLAIFGVESRTTEGMGHWIAGDHENYYDPVAVGPKPWGEPQWKVDGGVIMIERD